MTLISLILQKLQKSTENMIFLGFSRLIFFFIRFVKAQRRFSDVIKHFFISLVTHKLHISVDQAN